MSRPCGSHVKYVVERCRCDDCRAANRAYELNRQRAIRRGWQPYVDAGAAREHVEWLRTCGIGLKTLAVLAGVPHGSLSKLMYGDPKRGMAPSKGIRPETSRRILAVMPWAAAGRQRVPAAHTWRLLNDLVARGWTKSELARRLGRQTRALQLGDQYVLGSTARAVEQLHAELITQPAPPRRTRWSAA